jgi:hypothetical protein
MTWITSAHSSATTMPSRAGSLIEGVLEEEIAMQGLRTVALSLLVIVIVLIGYSYLSGNAYRRYPFSDRPAPVGTSGSMETARERGAEIGGKVAVAAAKVRETADEAALTSKIKAKMVLDDYVKARAIDVTTNDSTVTLSGIVRSVDEHDRALRLARETTGVTDVIDRLRVEVK